jgi:hypothetical protein
MKSGSLPPRCLSAHYFAQLAHSIGFLVVSDWKLDEKQCARLEGAPVSCVRKRGVDALPIGSRVEEKRSSSQVHLSEGDEHSPGHWHPENGRRCRWDTTISGCRLFPQQAKSHLGQFRVPEQQGGEPHCHERQEDVWHVGFRDSVHRMRGVRPQHH